MVDLTPEHTIDKNKVGDGQGHAKAPEKQSNVKRVRPSSRVVDADMESWIGGRNQQIGIERGARAYQHEDQVCRGCKKRRFVIAAAAIQGHRGETRANTRRYQEKKRIPA